MHTRKIHDVTSTTQDCESICLRTIQYCQQIGGAHADAAHLQILQDCADICETTAKFASRSSAQQGSVTSACADICELCAVSCEKFSGDAQMKACANQCYLCAAACQQSSASSSARAEGGRKVAQPPSH